MAALHSLLQDAIYTLRQFRNRPGFAIVAALVLGLGLGANAAIFSVVDAVLLHTLPYADPGRLIVLFERGIQLGSRASISFADFEDWKAQSRTVENLAVAREEQFNLAGDLATTPERISGAICSWTLFPALGNSPILGRVFTAGDDQPGGSHVAIIGYSLWQSRFAGDRDVLSQRIRLDSQDYRIIGVMPRGFSYPRSGSEVWIPVQQIISQEARTRRGWRQFHGIARLRPGSSVEETRLELETIARRIKLANPELPGGDGAFVFPLEDFVTQNIRTSLLVMFGAVGCVLLIACVNIANLLLARASRRQREIAIRSAIGASRARIMRQLLTESLMLALLGAGFGLMLAAFMIDALAATAPALINRGAIQPTGEIRLDLWVFLFTAAVAVAVGLAVGIVPALQTSRTDLTSQLKDGSRSVTAGRAQNIFRNALVSAEVALSLVLLIAAGLLLRSFSQIRSVHPGIRADHLLTVGISLPSSGYKGREPIGRFAYRLTDKLRALPGVRGADISTCLPVDGFCGDQFFSIVGRPLPPGEMLDSNNWAVSPDFFATLGIPMLRGRGFTMRDVEQVTTGSKRYTAVINESMAKKFWPGEDPLGQAIYLGDSPDDPHWEIVGVCGDFVSGLDRKPEPAYFFPFSGGWNTFYTVIRSDGSPEALSAAVRQEIRSLDADVPAFKMRTMEDVLDNSSSNRRFSALLIGLFAAMALLLAAIGLYGVLSYLVSQRISEIGIRMVLGATRTEVQRLVLAQGMRPVFVGLGIGLAAALGAGRVLRSLLFGVSPVDPATFATVTVLLLAVALIACYVPAFRAALIDPAVALRKE